MNEEDLDWRVYHLLLEGPCQSPDALAAKAGCSSVEIEGSLRRLENLMLIARERGGSRVLSVQEMLLQCQSRYDPRSPFTVEGGVIRVKKEQD